MNYKELKEAIPKMILTNVLKDEMQEYYDQIKELHDYMIEYIQKNISEETDKICFYFMDGKNDEINGDEFKFKDFYLIEYYIRIYFEKLGYKIINRSGVLILEINF